MPNHPLYLPTCLAPLIKTLLLQLCHPPALKMRGWTTRRRLLWPQRQAEENRNQAGHTSARDLPFTLPNLSRKISLCIYLLKNERLIARIPNSKVENPLQNKDQREALHPQHQRENANRDYQANQEKAIKQFLQTALPKIKAADPVLVTTKLQLSYGIQTGLKHQLN